MTTLSIAAVDVKATSAATAGAERAGLVHVALQIAAIAAAFLAARRFIRATARAAPAPEGAAAVTTFDLFAWTALVALVLLFLILKPLSNPRGAPGDEPRQ